MLFAREREETPRCRSRSPPLHGCIKSPTPKTPEIACPLMCLFKLHREEPELEVPIRVHRRSTRRRDYYSPPRHQPSVVRVSHHSVREAVPSPSVTVVSKPSGLAVPAPQPVPVFVQPAPPSPRLAPPRHSDAGSYADVNLVEVSPSASPRSSADYRRIRIERERDYSPARSELTTRSSRGDRYETFRYVEPAGRDDYLDHHRRSRSRHRSHSRSNSRYLDEPVYRREREERIIYVDRDGHRDRNYYD